MNKEETKGLFLLVKGSYPNAYRDIDEVQLKIMVNSWHSFFEDIPVQVMVKVVQKHILNSVYPPSVKELREEALKIVSPTLLVSPEEAWESGMKAIRKFGRYRKDEGMATLSDSTKRVINSIGWERLCNCTDEDLGYLKNDFVKFYSDVEKDNKQVYLMPQGMLAKLQTMANQRQIEQKDELQ